MQYSEKEQCIKSLLTSVYSFFHTYHSHQKDIPLCPTSPGWHLSRWRLSLRQPVSRTGRPKCRINVTAFKAKMNIQWTVLINEIQIGKFALTIILFPMKGCKRNIAGSLFKATNCKNNWWAGSRGLWRFTIASYWDNIHLIVQILQKS